MDLAEGEIHLRSRALFEGEVADVTHDADDAAGRLEGAGVDLAAESFLTMPEMAGDGFVDDDGGFGFGGVAFGEVAAFYDPDAGGGYVAVADDVDEGFGILVGFVSHAVGGDAPSAVAAEGQRVDDARGFGTRERADAAEDVVEIGIPAGDGGFRHVFPQKLAWHVDAHGGGPGGLEAEVDVEDAEETADEESGSNEQDAGEGDFGDDEDGPEEAVVGRIGCGAALFFEGFAHVSARDVEGGRESEDDAAEDGEGDGEGESGPVEADGGEQGDVEGGESGESARTEPGEAGSDGGGEEGEEKAFGEDLPDEAGTASAEGGADGEFLLAGGAANEE